MEKNPWLALSRIMGPLNISDEMAKTTTQNKSTLLMSGNIPQTASGKAGGAIRKTYPSGIPEAKEGQRDLDAFTRR